MATKFTKKQLEEMVQTLTAKLAAQVQVPEAVAVSGTSNKQKDQAVLDAVSSIVKDRKGFPQWVMDGNAGRELRATLIDLMQKKHQEVTSPDPVRLKKTVVRLVIAGRLISNKYGQLVTKAQNVSKERKAKGYVIGAENAERYTQTFALKYKKYAPKEYLDSISK
jgi:hypothetical protein